MESGTVLRRSTRLWRTNYEASRRKNLCAYCRLIKIPKSYEYSNECLYQRTLREIRQAADKGCTMCQFFNQLLIDITNFDHEQPNAVFSLQISQCEDAYASTRRPTQVQFMLDQEFTSLRFDICKISSTMTGQDAGRTDQYEEEHPQEYDGHIRYFPRLVERDPLSNATMKLIRDWLSACTNHPFCRTQEPRPLPKRLIDVRSSPKVWLTEHNGEFGHYLALSHCWGSADDAFSTTRDNVAERTSMGIELSELPNNFQHAIAFTRRLGYDYVWIDSLCIMQHEQADWQCEASKMAQYYSNAVLTLAIADARTCHVGFLHFRNHSTSPSFAGEGRDYYCLREVLQDDLELDTKSPISKRAWTLLERLISPRIIHVTRDQLLWHCRECEWAEGYVDNTDRSYDEFRLGCQKAGYFIDREEVDAYWRSRSSDPAYQPYFDSEFAAEIWYKCISEYTTRSLTQPSDIFAAIAGLAEKYAHPDLGRYLAGIWEQDFFRGLAWTRVKIWETIEDQHEPYVAINAEDALAGGGSELPLLYRAPSWSWASVNGPVEINNALFYFAKRGSSPEMQYEVKHWETEYGPRLVNCALRHSRENPYLDTLEGSFIQLEGYCRPLWVSKMALSSKSIGPKGPFVKDLIFDNIQPCELYCYLNKPREVGNVSNELLILQICKQRTGLRFVYGLLLEQMHDTEDAYKRVGIIELACYNLCRIEKGPSTGFVYYMHPSQQRLSGVSKADYKTKEWQKDRWEKRTIKLF